MVKQFDALSNETTSTTCKYSPIEGEISSEGLCILYLPAVDESHKKKKRKSIY